MCHWCQKIGHLIEDCRAKKAGKPKVKPTRAAASLDQEGDWEEDDMGSITEEPVVSLEESIAMLLPVDEDQCGECGNSDCECSDSEDDDDDDWTDENIPEPPAVSPSTTPARPSFLSQFGSPSTPAASTLTVTSPSVSEIIAEQQRASRSRLDAILSPSPPLYVTPGGVESAATSVSALTSLSGETPVRRPVTPPGIPEVHPEARRPKKNRNKSAKAKLIKVFKPKECGPECGPECGSEHQNALAEEEIPVLPKFKPLTFDAGTSTESVGVNDVGTDAMEYEFVMKATTEAQTDTTLPHTMRNIMWSAEGLDPIVDCDDEAEYADSMTDESIMDKIMEGPTVSDIDALDENVSSKDDDDLAAFVYAMAVVTCYAQNLPEMRRFSHREVADPQGDLSPIFKMGNFLKNSNNADCEPKPDPEENKLQIICVEQHFDKIDENPDFLELDWDYNVENPEFIESDNDFSELTEFLDQSEEEIPEKLEEDFNEDFYWNHLEGPVKQWEILKSCIPEYRTWKIIQDNGPEYGGWMLKQMETSSGNGVQGARRVPADEPGHGETPIEPLFTAEVAGTRTAVQAKRVGGRRLRLRRGITIDSGAANNVMPRRMVRNKAKIRSSPSSRRGVNYVAANDGRIPNEGEFDFSFQTTEGNDETMVVQVAEVNKALGAVSYLVDHGYRVVFDKDLKTGRDISFMLQKAKNITSRFRRERNIWVLDAFVDNSENLDESFQRQA